MALSFDSKTSLLLVDVSLGPKIIQLPYASERPGRVLTIKDTGFCNINKSITIVCAGSGFSGDKFETGTSTYNLIFVNGYITVISDPSLPGWRIVAKSEINLPPQFEDVVTGTVSSINANLSTISTNNINTNNISATQITAQRAFFTNANIENLSVNVLFANIVSTAITQDITGVTVDNAYISSAVISSLVAYSTSISELYVNDIKAVNISSGVINLGFSSISTTIGTFSNISLSSFSTLSTAIAQLDYSTTVRYTSTVIGVQALTVASVKSTVQGLGTIGYISTTALAAYLNGLGSDGYVSTSGLYSSIAGLTEASQSSLQGLGSLGFLSSIDTSMASTTRGLGSIGYVSTLSLRSTTQGLGQIYVSTIITNAAYITSTTQGLGRIYVSTQSMASSLEGLGQIYVSTIITNEAYITSTTQGLGRTYVSTQSMTSSLQGLGRTYVSTQSMTSSLEGLGSLGYISTIGTNSAYITSTTQGLGSLGYISTIGTDSNYIGSSITGLGTLGYISTGSLVSTVYALENTAFFSTANGSATSTIYGGGFIDTLTATLTSTIEGLSYATSLESSLKALGTQGYVSSLSLQSTVAGLGRAGYVSTTAMTQALRSTVGGLGSFYVSSISLKSSLDGLGQTYISTSVLTQALASTLEGNAISLQSTIDGLGELSYISTTSLTQTLKSTIDGLGKFYISSSGLRQALASSINGLGSYYISTSALQSSIDGLGETYISSTGLNERLASTIDGLASYYISTATLDSTIEGLGQKFVSTASLTQAITTAVNGLGQTYISSASLKSSLAGLGSLGYTSSISSDSIRSTVAGLGSSRYVSTSSLVSTVVGLGSTEFFTATTAYVTSTVYGLGYISTLAATLTSTVTGESYGSSLTSSINSLASIGYLSTPTLTSTIEGLGQKYISTLTVVPESLASTTQGLGQSYVSTPTLISTVEGLGQIFVSTLTVVPASLTSTTQGLGQRYISTPSLTSSIQGLGQRYISTVSLTSTVQGLGESYVSTASLFSTVEGLGEIFVSTLTVVPASLISTTQGLGQRYISTLSLTSTVQGLGQRYVSTLTVVPASLASTTQGLGETYVSTATLVSSLEGLGSLGYISTIITDSTYITSTIQGLGTLAYVSTIIVNQAYITSTTRGLGRIYVSTQSLTSSIQGLGSIYLSTAVLQPDLTSTVQGLGQTFVSTPTFVSTVQGLGTIYLSTSGLTSTVQGLGQTFVSTTSLTSTVEGLGSVYLSTAILQPGLTSTIQGLGQTYISTVGTDSAYITSTTTGLGSIGYLSTAVLQPNLTSSIQGLGQIYISAGGGGGPFVTTSTIILSDYSGISANSLFTSSSLLYYNSSIIAGTTVAQMTTALPGLPAISSAVGFVTTYAGNGFNGTRDGGALSAGFNTVRGLTFDSTYSTLTVIDSGNRLIRKVAIATSSATTYAGAYALSGFTDGYTSTARLLNPYYSVADAEGNIYFTEQSSNLIRRITPGGFISTIAGFGNTANGLIDGFGSNSRFFNPTGITIDSLGANLYVVDTGHHAVRRINLSTMYVSTIAGGVGGMADGFGRKGILSGPFGVNIDQAGANLYITPSLRVLRRYNLAASTLYSMAGSVSNAASASNGFLSNIGFNGMFNAIPDAGGNVYVSDYYGWRLRYITSNGIGTTVIGSNNGFADGPGATATVVPNYSIMDSTYTNIYIADPTNHRIRRYNIATSTVTTVVGNGNAASIDGLGGGTRFNFPVGMIIDSANANIYIGDSGNNRIRRLNLATSTVTTYAGNGTGNAIDGISTNTASLTTPEGIAIDSTGNLYYCDRNFHRVRKITTTGSVVSIVGSPTTNGSSDGIGAGALLTYPSGICIDSTGTNAYITEFNNNWVRRIVLATGQIIRLAGSGSAGSNDAVGTLATFNGPTGICIDNTNTNLYVCDQANNRIRQVVIATSNVTTLAGSGTPAFADGTGTGASFSAPRQICFNGGNVFITDANNNRIRRIVVSSGVTTTIAGSATASSVDGVGASASFNGPFGITIDSTATNLYVGDNSSHCIRRIRLSDSNVLTISGSNASSGYRDGIGAAGASLNSPSCVSIDSTNANLYFTEGNPGNRVRRVNLATSIVSTIAGSGTASALDGVGTSANFFNPQGLTVDTLGNVWVSEIGSHLIRRITLATTYVSTVAGSGSNTVDAQGINAAFKRPWGICIDPPGSNLFIAEYDGGRIRRLNIATTNVTTLIGTTVGFDMDGNVNGSMFNSPEGIAIDSTNSNLYVSDTVNNRIRVINLNTTYVSTVCGSGSQSSTDGIGILANLNRPGPLRFDTMSNLYIGENNSYRIKKLSLATTYLSTCAGTGGSAITDGIGSNAAFATFGAITFDSNASTMYIADQHRIRFMNMSSMSVSTLAGGGPSYLDNVSGSGAQFSNNFPGTPCIDSNNTIYAVEFNTLRMILSSGTVSTLTTTGMGNMTGIALDTTQSTLFIADANATRIWAMNLSTVTRTLKAGGGTVTGDGWALAASVNYPRGIACDSNNNVYYGEGNNNVVRKITPDGRIITVAGNGRGGVVINGLMGARFINPSGIALDSTGGFGLIADGGGGSSRIRRFNLTTFNASTIAGSGSNASTDGCNISASFLNTQGIARDASDNSYIGEQFRIRTVSSSGYVSTLIGSNASGVNDGIYTSVRTSSAIPQMAMVGSDLYFCDQGNNRIRRVNVTNGQTITVGGNGTASSTDGSWGGTRFSNPQSTCLDPTNTFLFIADSANNVIRRITLSTGLTETYVGSGTGGFLDGNAYTAQFNNPMGIWMDYNGILYVSDTNNNRIRKVDTLGNVTTLAGNGSTSFSNGIGTAATFSYPQGIAVDSTATNLYLSDFSNNRIRIITLATSNVATFAGSGTGTSTDGIGAAATFLNPQGIAIDATNTNLYVMDVNGSKFRSIVIGTSNVSTIAGNGTYANTDGTGANAAFHYSQSVALDGVGNAYTGNRGGAFLIRKIVLSTGVVTTFAGNATNAATDGTGTGASFGALGGGMCSDNNFLYVTDNSNLIRRVSLPGAVTTTIGGTRAVTGHFNGYYSATPATFNSPYGCVIDNTNTNMYISEQGGARIRRLVLATGVVTTVAGTGTSTWADGTGLSAGFNAPKGMFMDNTNGNLWITETNRIRKLVLSTSNVTTIAGGASSGSNDAIGASATFNDPRGILLNPAGTTLFVTDYGNCRIRSIDITQSNVSSIAGFSQGCADGTGVGGSLANPVNMTVDFNNNLYVKDVDNNRVRMLNLNTTFLSTFTTLTNTNGMAADPTNSSFLYMTTTSNIFRADISTQTFATFVGSNNVGYNDGFGSSAAFNGMTAACVDRNGVIYITESSRMRKIT